MASNASKTVNDQKVRGMTPGCSPLVESLPGRGTGALVFKRPNESSPACYYRYHLAGKQVLIKLGVYRRTPREVGFTLPELRDQAAAMAQIAKAHGDVKGYLAQQEEDAEAIVEHAMVPAAIAGQCVIGAATHLAQTRVNAWHPNDKPGGALCSLFTLSLFDSGEGKSSARDLAFKTIDEAEKDARARHRQACADIETMAAGLKGKAREEFLAAHPLPPDPKTQYSDATFESLVGDFIRGKAAASWETDEGGQMLGGHSLKADTVAATLGGLTTAFSSGKFERTRSRGNLEGSGVVYNRRLSIHLMAQAVCWRAIPSMSGCATSTQARVVRRSSSPPS